MHKFSWPDVVIRFYLVKLFTNMFKLKIERLISVYGIKQEFIIELIGSNRVAFPKKMDKNDFTLDEQNKIKAKYGALMN